MKCLLVGGGAALDSPVAVLWAYGVTFRLK